MVCKQNARLKYFSQNIILWQISWKLMDQTSILFLNETTFRDIELEI